MPQSHLFDVRHLRPRFNKKVPCKWNCRHFFIVFFFSSGCDRYVENDDECCNRTFLVHILPTLWKIFLIFDSYAPNFEEVEGAYWFGSVRPVQSVMRE